MGKKTNTNRMNSVEKLYSDFNKNQSKADLLALLVNKDFIKDNPTWLVEGDYEEGFIAEIFDLDLCQDLTDTDLLLVADLVLKTLNGFRDAHNDEQNYNGLMSKFVSIASDNDDYYALAQDMFNVIKAQYLDTINDKDATRIAIAITLQAALADILQINNVAFVAASSSMSSKEEIDMSKKNTEVLEEQVKTEEKLNIEETVTNDTPVQEAASDSEEKPSLKSMNLEKFSRRAKFHKVTKAEKEGKIEKVAGEVVEPVKAIEQKLTEKEKQVDERLSSLASTLCKELFNDCRMSVDNGTKIKISDEDLMKTMNKIAPKIIGSSYSADKIVSIDPVKMVKELNIAFISGVLAAVVADSIVGETVVAASNSVKPEVDAIDVFTIDHAKQIITKFPEIGKCITADQMVSCFQKLTTMTMDDTDSELPFVFTRLIQITREVGISGDDVMELIIIFLNKGDEITEFIDDLLPELDSLADTIKTKHHSGANKTEHKESPEEMRARFRKELEAEQEELTKAKSDRKLDIDTAVDVKMAWIELGLKFEESKTCFASSFFKKQKSIAV